MRCGLVFNRYYFSCFVEKRLKGSMIRGREVREEVGCRIKLGRRR